MYREAALFLFLIPSSVLFGVWLFLRRWRKYPTGRVVEVRGEKKEEKRILAATKEIHRLENGGE